jgi:hypothetical protein
MMGVFWWMALQATIASPGGVLASDFDLAKARATNPWVRGCQRQNASEIVVCGRSRGGNGPSFAELEELERQFRDKPVRAEARIGKSTLRAYGDSVQMPGGQISKRAMIGIKMPF